MPTGWLWTNLQLLVGPFVFLLQLLRLLLMPLLYLRCPRISPALPHPLVLLLLFLLELPSLLFLPRKELFLVLLVSLLQLWAACVGNARACTRRTVVRMDWSDGTRSRIAGPWPSSRASTRRRIHSRRSLGCYYAVSPEFRRPRGGGNRRFAMIHGLIELSVGTCSLKMLRLNLAWWEMSLALRRLFRTSGASRDSAATGKDL